MVHQPAPGRRRLDPRGAGRGPDDLRPTQRARPPQPLPPCGWAMPPPEDADEDGVVGIGADLAPSTLVAAYRHGIFPWPHPGIPLPWFSPDPRGILTASSLHVSRSLRRTLRGCGWTTTVDHAFDRVVAGCAAARGPEGTWITGAMARAFRRLHDLGWAHSLEVWDGDLLVGGVYGVHLGTVFTGESMFHRASDASKVALVDLLDRLVEAGGGMIDAQLTTPHLVRMGAVDVARAQFLDALRAGRDADVRLLTGPMPVARLASARPGGAEAPRVAPSPR